MEQSPKISAYPETAGESSEYGIALDGAAQQLGLDIFAYTPGDVYRAIAELQATALLHSGCGLDLAATHAASEANGWVSVKHFLPRKERLSDERYLVWIDDPASHIEPHIGAVLFTQRDQQFRGREDFGPTGGVTHWQSLPAPPTTTTPADAPTPQ